MEWPRYNDRSRRNSLRYIRLRTSDLSKFQYQLLVDGNVDLFLCQMVFLLQKYSKKTIEVPYRKSIPGQSNKISTNFIYLAFFEICANQKQCKKINFKFLMINALHFFQ